METKFIKNQTLLENRLNASNSGAHAENLLKHNLVDAEITVCSRCIYDERFDEITFDNDGVCNFCHQNKICL